MSSRDKKAFLIALPVATFLAAICFILFGLLGSDRFYSQESWSDLPRIFAAYLLFMLPFVAFAGTFVGLPSALFLRRLHIRNVMTWLAVGSVCGGIASFLILGSLAVHVTAEVAIWASSIGGIPGFAAALIWWSIAERHQPEDLIDA